MSSFSALFLVAYVALAFALFGVAFATLWWMLHAWRSPAVLDATRFPREEAQPKCDFSLIVPARHEEAVLGATLDQLLQMAHPAYELVVVVGDDDDKTFAVADDVARSDPRVTVIVDDSRPKNKPKALNAALPHCRGNIIGVFDAEDEVHPNLLTRVDAAFQRVRDGRVPDVVQGGVQLMNYQSSWYALRNCLEYFFWFRSRLHLHAQHRFIPLGGNTVFVRADVLRAHDGWDGECLAEDCDLGVRLSSSGANVAVAYDPELVTREETPDTLRGLIRQRTRWDQGFLQVLRKGAWRELPLPRQRALARFTLARPFLQAFAGVLIPISVATLVAAHVPIWVAMLSFLPLAPTCTTVVCEAVGLRDFCRQYGQKATARDYARLLVGTIPYQLVLSYAAVRAVARETVGVRGWEKTSHVGAHREMQADAFTPVAAGD